MILRPPTSTAGCQSVQLCFEPCFPQMYTLSGLKSIRSSADEHTVVNEHAVRMEQQTVRVIRSSAIAGASADFLENLYDAFVGMFSSVKGSGSGGTMLTSAALSSTSPFSTRSANSRVSSYKASSICSSVTVRF